MTDDSRGHSDDQPARDAPATHLPRLRLPAPPRLQRSRPVPPEAEGPSLSPARPAEPRPAPAQEPATSQPAPTPPATPPPQSLKPPYVRPPQHQSHEHSHEHSHDHSHSHGAHCSHDHSHGLSSMLAHDHDYRSAAANPSNRKYIAWALWINLAFLLAEVIGGIVFNSVALLSDAAHMLTDVGALALALGAAKLAERPADGKRTYGFGRAETLAGLFNAVTLIAASAWIVWEATTRLMHPVDVGGGGVMVIALLGLLVNVVATLWLMRADRQNVNVRAALAHSIMDAVSSVGVLLAGAIILLSGWNAADPIAGYVVAALSVIGAWPILRRCLHELIDSAPGDLHADAVARRLLDHPAVTNVHDVHLWTISSGDTALTAHVRVLPDADVGTVAHELEAVSRAEFNVGHPTFQIVPDRRHQLWEIGRFQR